MSDIVKISVRSWIQVASGMENEYSSTEYWNIYMRLSTDFDSDEPNLWICVASIRK